MCICTVLILIVPQLNPLISQPQARWPTFHSVGASKDDFRFYVFIARTAVNPTALSVPYFYTTKGTNNSLELIILIAVVCLSGTAVLLYFESYYMTTEYIHYYTVLFVVQ